jgi:hypothetical protein
VWCQERARRRPSCGPGDPSKCEATFPGGGSCFYDHSDHDYSALFALAARISYAQSHTFRRYGGYSSALQSENVTGADFTLKQSVFQTYAEYDRTVVHVPPFNFNGDYSTWLLRQYVLYDFTGFFQPVDNLPTFNQVKAGQAIPVKFSLGGYYGLGIFAAGSPTSQQIACDGGAPVDEVEETVTAGGSTLAYDAASTQYKYTWKTDKAWAGQCRQLSMTLNYGTVHTARFNLK